MLFTLFIMLLYFPGVRDLYQRTTSSSSENFNDNDMVPEVSRKKMCISFLQSIDQIGRYEAIYTSSLYDPVMNERNHRMDIYSQVNLHLLLNVQRA